MKTSYLHLLLAVIVTSIFSLPLYAQHTEIVTESKSTYPHLDLEETEKNDFSRLFFTNENEPVNKWSLAGRVGTFTQLGAFYNGETRFSFDEDKHEFMLRSTSSQPELDLLFSMDDGAGGTATSFGNVTWSDDVGGTFAQIRAFSNQSGSAIPEYLTLSGGMAGGVGSNFMTMWNGYTDFGASSLISGGGSGRVRISHNSTTTSPQLRVIEDGAGDFARIMYTNTGSSSNFAIAARPGSTAPRWQVAYDGEEILTVHADDIQDGLGNTGRVGINDTSPTYALELPNNALDRIGQIRSFDHDTYSDRRVKTSIVKIENGLSSVMQLNPVRYDHHSSEFGEKGLVVGEDYSHELGFIAQEIYDILPEAAYKPENENEDLWAVSYERIIPVLTKAIQEQQNIINSQKSDLAELKDEMASLKLLMNSMVSTN